MRRKLWFSTILVLLLTGFTAAQNTGFTPDPSTSGDTASGKFTELQKTSILSQIFHPLSVAIRDAGNQVNPGEKVEIRNIATFKESLNVEGNIQKALVYRCPSGDRDCPEQKDRPRELKVGDPIRNTIQYSFTVSDGSTYNYGLNYIAPSEEGLYKVYAGITSDDESRWVTDVTSTTFRVQAATGDDGGSGSTVDTDGDGVSDGQDLCPERPGSLSNGCPSGSSDNDGDGVSNEADLCDNTPGPKSNNGCPESSGLPVIPLVAGLGALLVIVGVVVRYG